jgi:hypothetical protein
MKFHVVIFPDRLEQREPGTAAVFLWEKMESVRSHSHPGLYGFVLHVTYTVHLVDGRSFEPGQWRDRPFLASTLSQRKRQRLIMTIEQELSTRRLPQMRQRYDDGETIQFGTFLAVNNQDLKWGDIKIPWTEVEKIECDAYNRVYVRLLSGGVRVLGSVDKVENFFLFMALLTYRP